MVGRERPEPRQGQGRPIDVTLLREGQLVESEGNVRLNSRNRRTNARTVDWLPGYFSTTQVVVPLKRRARDSHKPRAQRAISLELSATSPFATRRFVKTGAITSDQRLSGVITLIDPLGQ